MEWNESYQETAEQNLKTQETLINKLNTMIKKGNFESMEEFHAEIKKLESKHEVMISLLKSMKESDEDKWKKLQQFETATSEFVNIVSNLEIKLVSGSK